LAFSFLLCRFVLVPASVYICAAFWDSIGRGLFGFRGFRGLFGLYLFCVASSEPTLVFSFGFELLSWRPCSHNWYDSTMGISSFPLALLLVFATTLGVSDPAELNYTISSANVSSIIYRFLYCNGASVPVSCLLVLVLFDEKTNFCVVFFLVFLLRRRFVFLVSS
jgi:hypothetical protein